MRVPRVCTMNPRRFTMVHFQGQPGLEVSNPGMVEGKALAPNPGGLVLGCIGADVSE